MMGSYGGGYGGSDRYSDRSGRRYARQNAGESIAVEKYPMACIVILERILLTGCLLPDMECSWFGAKLVYTDY